MDRDKSRGSGDNRGHRGQYTDSIEDANSSRNEGGNSFYGDNGSGQGNRSGGYDRGRSYDRRGSYDRNSGHDRSSGGYNRGGNGGHYNRGGNGGYSHGGGGHGGYNRVGGGSDRYNRGGYDRGGDYDRSGGYDRGNSSGSEGNQHRTNSSSRKSIGYTPSPHGSPRAAEPPTKYQRFDDEAGSSASHDPTPSAEGSAPSKGERRKRPDRYEIVNTIPTSFTTKNGKAGDQLKLYANFFKLNKKPNWEMVQYRVDFNPECELLPKRKYLMYTQRALLGGYLYDTKNTVYLTHRLPQDNIVIDSPDREGNIIQITFKFAGIISMSTRESLQVLNLILRRAMDGLNLQLVGRNLFDAAAKIDVHEFNLQVWPGYTTSIRQHENDILLCVEIASKVMRNETLYDILLQSDRENLTQSFSSQVLGSVVLTDYNNKTYRVDDVNFEASPSDTFETKKWGTISFIDYYKRKYGITIRNPSQPMLLTRSKEKQLRGGEPEIVALIPELCRPTGLSEKQRSNFHLMKSLSQHTRMDPGARMRKLNEFNGRLSNTQASVDMLKTWNFEVDRQLVQIPGRVLKNENIIYGNNVKEPTSARSSDWQFRNKAMFLTYPLERWTILTPHKMAYQVDSFVQNLMKISREMNFQVARPQIFTLNDDRNHAYLSGFDDAIRTDPQLVMAFVPNNNADRYANIKKMGCVNHGVPTQVVVQRTLNNKGIMSIATKVLIQLNCKIGGIPWLIHIPMGGLMTVGIDIARDSKDKNYIWAALVATMCLKNVTKESFFSTVTRHNHSEEFSTQLGLNMVKALKCYQEMNGGALPKKICIYRDGVGEGQTQFVMEHEVKQLEERLNAIYSQPGVDTPLKFSFIIVSKKINARIFARNENPPPGTVVDDIITLPERYDFYLVSQSVRQGTVSPTSYNVVYDSMGLSADQLQQLTYKHTHLYYNWTGTVRVPAVCQYAHKLTFLIAQCLHAVPLSALDKKLYFL